MRRETMTYQEYMSKVDAVISQITGGLTSQDLADFCTYDYFEAGVPPEETAHEILEGEGYPF
jgi:hypothetical protein